MASGLPYLHIPIQVEASSRVASSSASVPSTPLISSSSSFSRMFLLNHNDHNTTEPSSYFIPDPNLEPLVVDDDDELMRMMLGADYSKSGEESHDDGYGGAWSFYAFVTPLIIVLGFIGNSISLKVFMSSRLRHVSASCYLAALSASDNVVLVTYVLCDWLLRGLSSWNGGVQSVNVIHKQGFCQSFLFLSYLSRFISVYLIVAFTVERYIAVCRPLQRRVFCTRSFAQRIILCVTLLGAFLCAYKPLLSGLYSLRKLNASLQNNRTGNSSNSLADLSPEWFFFGEVLRNTTNDESLSWLSDDDTNQTDSDIIDWLSSPSTDTSNGICTWNPEYENVHFVLELVYGLSITAIPLILVAVFNLLMLKKLVTRHYLTEHSVGTVFRRSKIRIEFTVTVLVVSTCFVCLNIPYFIVWLRQNLQSFNPEGHDVVRRNSDLLVVTRTIFSINYSINFFVYCLTGSYYRSVLRNIFGLSLRKSRRNGGRFNGSATVYEARSTTLSSKITHSTEV